jgi:hypothetical protein
MIWNNPPTPECAPSSTLTCTTDTAGQCKIVYRRLRDLTGNAIAGPVGAHTLLLSTPGAATPSPLTINIIAPGSVTAATPHFAQTFIYCTSGATMTQTTLTVPGHLHGQFPATDHVNVSGSSASLTCEATVIDTDGNSSPALDCDPGPPWGCSITADQLDGHSPLGVITWDWPGKPASGPPGYDKCILNRRDSYASQAPNQTPFASTCSMPSLAVSGSGALQLKASYSGATHKDNTDSISVVFP